MKTKYFESKPGTLVCALTGAEYPYTVSDKASRQTAADKLAANQTRELERMREKQPGLTDRQHFFPSRVPHTETRTPKELKAKRIADAPRQPTGPTEPVNPFAGAMERATKRRGRLWAESEGGRKYRLDMEAASAEWEANQKSAKEQADFEASIAPVVAHAQASLVSVRRDPSTTQAEVEQAEERLKLAQSDVAAYSQADREWRQRQSEKIVAQAVDVDAQLNQLRQQRDALLQAAYEPPAAEPQLVPVTYPDNFYDPDRAGKTIMEPLPS